MKRCYRKRMAGLLVGCCLVVSGVARGGPYVNLMQPCDCPPNHYSAMEVLTPALYRWAAWCQGPCRYTFARMLHPDTRPTHHVVRYHCPSVNPLQFSLANYPGLDGNMPASTYTSPSAAQQTPRENPPQELPAPREMKARPVEKLPPPNEEPEKK